MLLIMRVTGHTSYLTVKGGYMVSQVLGSNAVLYRAVVLFCEISGFHVLVVCLLLGMWILTQNKKNILPRSN